MPKNISVVDEQGNIYEATYPKRAKGLIRKGRARFVDETAICLVRPPDKTEGINMDTEGRPEEDVTKTEASEGCTLKDIAFVVQKIDQIMAETDYLRIALERLENLDEAQAVAAGNIVESRERTNQSMIKLLEKLIDKMTD